MKKYFLIFLLLPFIVIAHGGDDHAEGKKTTMAGTKYFSSSAISEKYELLLKYAEIEPGTKATYKLFISNYKTNHPIDSAKLNISVIGKNNIGVEWQQVDLGEYELKFSLPDTAHYNLNIQVNALLGPDLLQINDVHIGDKLGETEKTKTENESFFSHLKPFFLGVLVTIIFLVFYNLMKRKKVSGNQLILILSLISFPISTSKVSAHGGDDHAEGGTSTSSLSNAFLVEKETQFLFEFYTKKLQVGNFNSQTEYFGNVIPSNNGRAVVQSPQVGKIISINATVGQMVVQGQVLATVELQIDPSTQISWQSEKNNVETEYLAAKKQYERLKSIEDIAAKKDVLEAEVRYQRAFKNKELFEKNNKLNTSSVRFLSLRSPISGVLSPFNLAVGSIVNPSESLFEIMDSKHVLIEAQIFDMNAEELFKAQRISVLSINNKDTMEYDIKLVSNAQKINVENQSKQFFFTLKEKNQKFVVGQNVKIKVYSSQVNREIMLPNSSIIEVGGKPAVFIKDGPEQISISFITKGIDNGKYSIIKSGAEEGERIIINNVYQLKNIFLNQ